jgi:hypothetical protein
MRRFVPALVAVMALAIGLPAAQDKKSSKSTGKDDTHATHAATGKVPKATCLEPTKACAEECLSCMKCCITEKRPECAKMCETCHHACWLCYHAVQGKNPLAWDVCELCEKMCVECAKM